MTKKRSLASQGPEVAVAEQPLAITHLKGSLQDPMWPSLSATEVAEITRFTPDDVRAFAELGWMPTACFIRDGDRFAFRASAVAWLCVYLWESQDTGLAVTRNGNAASIDIDMVARPKQATEVAQRLTRLTPEILDAAFKLEVLRPGALSGLKYEFEFGPAIALAAVAWWQWIETQYSR